EANHLPLVVAKKNDNPPSAKPLLSQNSKDLEQTLAHHSNFSRAQYIDAIQSVRENIRLGNVYQVNLSQRFTMPCVEGAGNLYRQVSALSPPRYGAYIRLALPESCAVLSNSPELFF